MICTKCGLQNRQGAQFCHYCGAAMQLSQPDVPVPVTRPLPSVEETMTTGVIQEGRSGNTQPLARLDASFAALPYGALLHQGSYEVLEVRLQSPQQNVYLVKDVQPVRVCPNCHVSSAQADDLFCAECGAALATSPEVQLRYQVYEDADPTAFAVAEQLLALRLHHPALILPELVFSETPYGVLSRRYLVMKELLFQPASALKTPQDPIKVLRWGMSLAQGLDYLHHHFVTLPHLAPTAIVVSESNAFWANWQAPYIIPVEQRSNAQAYFSQDLQNLAGLLAYFASGQQRPESIATLPETAVAVLSRALDAPTSMSAALLATGLEQALRSLTHPVGVVLRVGYRTDVGVERRLNEDSISALTLAQSLGAVGTPVGLYVVADGMGGHDAGELASRFTVQAIIQKGVAELLPLVTSEKPLPDGRVWLKEAISTANQVVHEQRKAAGTDMGNTCVAALFIGDKAVLGNAGDSRGYLLTATGIEQLTVDHSLVERLVATGQITREEAAHHPQKNVIYRVIGDKPQIEVDLFEWQLEAGNAILLCTDGLSGMVRNDDIWQIWRTSTSPQEACDRLVQAANHAGGEDNISVIVIQLAH